MIRFKQAEKENRPRKGFLIYENMRYGFRMQYPSHWIEYETNKQDKNFVTVLEFRTTIENKFPFVTLFIKHSLK
jgi:hypothetical protein